MPIWFIFVSAIWSRTYPRMGLLATGISCFAQVKVRGRSLVPLPPLRTRAFMFLPQQGYWVSVSVSLALKHNPDSLTRCSGLFEYCCDFFMVGSGVLRVLSKTFSSGRM